MEPEKKKPGACPPRAGLNPHFLHTAVLKGIAEKIYERHCFFTEQLIAAGVDPETAENDACRMEHVISAESFEKMKAAAKK